MTDFPPVENWVDGVPHPATDIADLINATDERVGTLPSDYTGKASAVIAVSASASGPEPMTSSSIADFKNGYSVQQTIRTFSFDRTQPAISSGAVAINGAIGRFFDVSLTANVNATAITESGFPSSGRVDWELRLKQDATGGRTVGGGTDVAEGFSDATFDFGVDSIELPTAASSWVCLHFTRYNTGEKWIVTESARRD